MYSQNKLYSYIRNLQTETAINIKCIHHFQFVLKHIIRINTICKTVKIVFNFMNTLQLVNSDMFRESTEVQSRTKKKNQLYNLVLITIHITISLIITPFIFMKLGQNPWGKAMC